MTIKAAAAALGVSREWVRRLMHDGRLPYTVTRDDRNLPRYEIDERGLDAVRGLQPGPRRPTPAAPGTEEGNEPCTV